MHRDAVVASRSCCDLSLVGVRRRLRTIRARRCALNVTLSCRSRNGPDSVGMHDGPQETREGRMTAERKQFRLGLVGYGEIGSTIGRGLRGAGLAAISCYDKYAFDGPYADLIQSRGREAGVTLVRSNQELADAADVIFSVTPGSASLESAQAFAPCLTSRHLFTDFASATPKIKIGVAERLKNTGALIGDGSIEGSPLQGYSMRMLSSGAAGQRICDLLVPWGMQIDFVGEKLGTASGIKILRSVLMKGIE